MTKKILIIIISTVAIVAIGITVAYITLRQRGEEVKKEQEVVIIPEKEIAKPKELTISEHIDISNWKIYRNEELGFELKYPQESTIVDSVLDENGIRIDLPIIQKSTLLREKYLQIKVDPETARWRYACLDPEVAGLTNVEWVEWEENMPFEGEMMGHKETADSIYEFFSSFTGADLHCYVFTSVLQSMKPEIVGENPTSDFDRTKEKEVFYKILSTVEVFIPKGSELP